MSSIYLFNCQIKENCPIQNQCFAPNIILRGDVQSKVNNDYKFHKTLEHNKNFNNRQLIKNTGLCKYNYLFKNAGTPYNIKESIILKEKVKKVLQN